MRKQSNKRSRTRLIFFSRLARPYGRVRLLCHALPISLLILRKKTRLFCSLFYILHVFKHVASLGIWHFNKLWTKLFHDSLLHLIDLWSSNTDWWITRIRAVMTVHLTLWVISHYLCLRIQPYLLSRSSSFTIQSYLYLSNRPFAWWRHARCALWL